MSVMVSPRGQHRAPHTGGRLTAERVPGRRVTAGLLVLGLAFTALVLTAADALADIRITGESTFPTQTQVGDQNLPFRFTVENISTDPDRGKELILTNAGITPACAEFVGTTCVQPEPDVFQLRTGPAAAVGVAGSCVGTTFTVTGPDAEGRYNITPEQPVVLGPSDGSGPEPRLCQFEMLIEEVTRTPTTDVDPGQPGIQTRHQIDARADDPATGDFATFTRSRLVTVFPGEVAIETLSDPNMANDPMPVPPGTTSTDTATVRDTNPGDNTPQPTGDVFFQLIGPDPDADCTTPVAFESGPHPIDPATGEAVSDESPPLEEPGLYNWVATFESADNNFGDVTEPQGCGDDRERFLVQPAPTIDVVKTADPETQPAPTGTFTFDVEVTNTGVNPVTITSLTDDIYGDLNDPDNPNIANNTCAGAVGTALDPDETFTCSFDGDFTGNPGDEQTDVVTATAEDQFGQEAQADDDATVGLVFPAQPEIDVDKTADPLEQPAPGGDFTFTVVVTNTGPSRVTITELDDDIYGDLNDLMNPDVSDNTCEGVVGTELDPGESFTCSFVGEFTGEEGDSQTDIVTAVAEDQFGQEAQADDDAVVTLGPPPMIQVVKTVDPEERPTPGGDFSYTVVVTNNSTLPLAITALDDDQYGDLDDPDNPNVENNTCEGIVGTVLQPDESVTCTFDAEFLGGAGDSHTNIVTVEGVDQFGNVVTDDDDATVTIVGIPEVELDKSADPESLPTPGGTFTFTVVITNIGPDAFTIIDLDDDVYGDLNDPDNPNVENNTCAGVVGLRLDPGESHTCTFDGEFTGSAGDEEIDTIIVVVETDDGVRDSDEDDAVVIITGEPDVAVDKTADPLSLPEPGGTFTFTVVVTNTSLDPVTITSLTDDVYGDLNDPDNPDVENNTCEGAVGTGLAPSPGPGHTFTCTFDGVFTGVAGDTETDTVTVVVEDATGQEATDSDDATVTLDPPPAIQVVKTADPTSLPAPGGTFGYTVVVTNNAVTPLEITSLVDDQYGDLNDPANPEVSNNTCEGVVGTTLDPGESFTCTFDADFTGDEGDTHTNVVTVVGEDPEGNEVTDDDDATVTLDPPPAIQVVKTADPTTLPAPGGTFGYTVVVTNNANTTLTITSLVDDQYGDLNDPANPEVSNNTCEGIVGTELDPGASVTCTFDADFTGDEGDTHTNVVTVVGEDPEGNEVTDDDDATVILGPEGDVGVDEPPVIVVDKTASPTELPVPGGEFTFTLTVTNPGVAPVTITSLVDDVHGDLDGQGTCAVGATLAAEGGTYTCQFTVTFTGEAGDTETNVITVVAEDEEGRQAVDEDDAVITIVPVEEPPPPPVVEPPPPPTPARALPVTGLDLMPLVAVAGALLAMGGMLLAKTPVPGRHTRRGHRRRRHARRRWALG